MSNPFEAHGIAHLSPSSIHAFMEAPALWVIERLLKKPTPPGASMPRGNAAEDGIVAGLENPSKDVEECVELAMAKYRALTALLTDPNIDDEGKMIPPMVRSGIATLRPYGVPSHTQGRVEKSFDGLTVPVMGYFDLLWEQHGRLIDIKTTSKMPSQIKTAHAEQTAFYTSCISENIQTGVAYFTKLKSQVYTLENVRAHTNAIHRRALSIQKFLSQSTDPYELAQMVTPNYDHFYWRSPVAKRNGFEVYGF